MNIRQNLSQQAGRAYVKRPARCDKEGTGTIVLLKDTCTYPSLPSLNPTPLASPVYSVASFGSNAVCDFSEETTFP